MYKKRFISLLLALTLGFLFISIQPAKLMAASVDVLNNPCTTNADGTQTCNSPCLNGASASSSCVDDQTTSSTNPIYGPDGILTKGILIVSWIVGIVSVIIIIISAIRMVASGGDSNTVNSARGALLYALIGVVIALTAQGIAIFILKKV